MDKILVFLAIGILLMCLYTYIFNNKGLREHFEADKINNTVLFNKIADLAKTFKDICINKNKLYTIDSHGIIAIYKYVVSDKKVTLEPVDLKLKNTNITMTQIAVSDKVIYFLGLDSFIYHTTLAKVQADSGQFTISKLTTAKGTALKGSKIIGYDNKLYFVDTPGVITQFDEKTKTVSKMIFSYSGASILTMNKTNKYMYVLYSAKLKNVLNENTNSTKLITFYLPVETTPIWSKITAFSNTAKTMTNIFTMDHEIIFEYTTNGTGEIEYFGSVDDTTEVFLLDISSDDVQKKITRVLKFTGNDKIIFALDQNGELCSIAKDAVASIREKASGTNK